MEWVCGGAVGEAPYPELNSTTTLVLAATGVAFAAFTMWLAIRIINRRERWAIWTAVAIFALATYPVSFGPACWITSRTNAGASAVPTIYRPMVWVMCRSYRIFHILDSYARLGSPASWSWSDWSGGTWTEVVPNGCPPPA